MDKGEEDEYTCPSFNSYSSNRLAELASRVAAENPIEDDEDEFEFPVFNRDLLPDGDDFASIGGEIEQSETSIAVPLSQLFLESRDNPPSCSSSEADELESVPEGSFCVWRPRVAEPPSPSRCKKSKSTGSASKRWKFRDLLLRRSNSEGKDSFVFLAPKNREEKLSTEIVGKAAKGKSPGRSVSAVSAASGRRPGSPSAHEALYVRNRAVKEGDKRKSYLPYRQDLVGLFVNVNGFGKGFQHF